MRDRPGTLRSARARSRVFPSARIRTRAGNPWSIGSVPYPFRHALMALRTIDGAAGQAAPVRLPEAPEGR